MLLLKLLLETAGSLSLWGLRYATCLSSRCPAVYRRASGAAERARLPVGGERNARTWLSWRRGARQPCDCATETETEGRALHFQTTSASPEAANFAQDAAWLARRGLIQSGERSSVWCGCSEHVRATGEATYRGPIIFYHQYRIVLLYLDRIYTCY